MSCLKPRTQRALPIHHPSSSHCCPDTLRISLFSLSRLHKGGTPHLILSRSYCSPALHTNKNPVSFCSSYLANMLHTKSVILYFNPYWYKRSCGKRNTGFHQPHRTFKIYRVDQARSRHTRPCDTHKNSFELSSSTHCAMR